ncbi:MAG: polysaccharide export protein [Sphingomonadales bacterium]|nr:MAG: polysaccharide export protein [Sphingomonadales bacterium]
MLNFRFLVGVLFSAIVLVSGCSRPAITGDQAVERSQPIVEQEYVLGVGDKVRVIVFNEEALSGEFQVSAAGSIALPLIGEVSAVGRTTLMLSAEMQKLYAEGYLRDPKVSVEVVTYRPYFILGEVKTPGQYPFSNGLTIMNAIAAATGFTPRADKKIVFIRRSGEATEKPYALTPDLRVYPGDTIRLAERFF